MRTPYHRTAERAGTVPLRWALIDEDAWRALEKETPPSQRGGPRTPAAQHPWRHSPVGRAVLCAQCRRHTCACPWRWA